MASKIGETASTAVGIAGRHDEQRGSLGRLRPAEHGCGDEALPGLGVRGAQPGGELHADRGTGRVYRPGAQRREDAPVAEGHRLDRVVVGQHRDHGLATAGVRDRAAG